MLRQCAFMCEQMDSFDDGVETLHRGLTHMPGPHVGVCQCWLAPDHGRYSGRLKLAVKDDAVVAQGVVLGHGNEGGRQPGDIIGNIGHRIGVLPVPSAAGSQKALKIEDHFIAGETWRMGVADVGRRCRVGAEHRIDQHLSAQLRQPAVAQ